MGVTYVSAPDRDAGVSAARTRQLDAGHVLLAGSSLITVCAIALAFSGRAAVDRARPQAGPAINLNAVREATELDPLFAPVFENAGDRRLAATRLYQFLSALRDRGERVPNVGAILEARVSADAIRDGSASAYKTRLAAAADRAGAEHAAPAALPLLTREDLAALKPLASVRTHDEHRTRVVRWTAVYVAAVWAVAVFWWACGIRGDYLLLSAAHLLTGLGFAALLSRQDPLRDTALFARHAMLTSAGLVCFAMASAVDVRRVARAGLTYLPLAGALALSAVLILFGRGPAGSNAKVNLGPLQPVEFIRLLLALFLAGYFTRHWDVLSQVRGRSIRSLRVPPWLNLPRLDYVVPVVAGVAAALLLFFLQKDLGPALFLSCVFLMTYAIARNRTALALIGFATLVAGFYLGYRLNISSTLTSRVAMWGSLWDNAARGGDQIAQAIWGLSTGGWSGTGLGLGDTGYVPAGYTDLMLAAIGEELGFVGLLAMAVVFATIAARGFTTALRAADDYGFFLATVLTLVLILPVLIMAAGMLGVLPLTGVVTPFVSFGGSAMIANFMALGILAAIARHPSPSPEATHPLRRGVTRLTTALSAAALGLVATLFNVQVLQADTYAVRAHAGIQADGHRRFQYNQRLSDALSMIPRGTVYDRHGLPLATGDPAVARRAHAAFRTAGLADASCPNSIQERCYPLGGATFHLLGDARDARNWTASNTAYVERDLQDHLRGFDDHATAVRLADASGRPVVAVRRDYRELIPLLRHRFQPNHPGAKALLDRRRDIILTVDAPLQADVSRILSKYAARSSTRHAAAVVIDPDTGDLLAVASYPFPDLDGDPDGPPDEALLDRARFGLYPPGSTFKLVTAAAALRQDRALTDATFMCSRQAGGRVGAHVGSWGVVRDDVLETHPHGTIDMHEGLVHSCNAYFAQLAVRVGPESMLDTANIVGISISRSPSLARLRATLPQAGYGQGDALATPLRMARVAAAMASNGVLRETRIERDGKAAATRVLLSPPAARLLGRYLRDAVVNGTGRSLRDHPWRIAGKTGTAEVDDAASHAWFVGYAPYGPAEKRVAFAILIENAGYGGLAAAPAAGEIVSAAAARGLIR